MTLVHSENIEITKFLQKLYTCNFSHIHKNTPYTKTKSHKKQWLEKDFNTFVQVSR